MGDCWEFQETYSWDNVFDNGDFDEICACDLIFVEQLLIEWQFKCYLLWYSSNVFYKCWQIYALDTVNSSFKLVSAGHYRKM